MDHTRDNPLKRFSAFWIALVLVGLFGVASLIIGPLTQRSQDTAYMLKEEERLQIREQIDKDQEAAMAAKKVDGKAISAFSKTLNGAPTPGAMAVSGAAQ